MKPGETEYIDSIVHEGTVESVDPRCGTLTVVLEMPGECGSCPAARLCQSAGSKDATRITVESKIAGAFAPGDRVQLVGTETMHRRAIMLATVIPAIILVGVMVGMYLLTGSQLAACLTALGMMILFFVALYLLRNKIAHEFTFSVRQLK